MKNLKQKLALVATTATVAATASAGKIADAITSNQAITDAQGDLYTAGSTVLGWVIVIVAFGAVIRLFRKG